MGNAAMQVTRPFNIPTAPVTSDFMGADKQWNNDELSRWYAAQKLYGTESNYANYIASFAPAGSKTIGYDVNGQPIYQSSTGARVLPYQPDQVTPLQIRTIYV